MKLHEVRIERSERSLERSAELPHRLARRLCDRLGITPDDDHASAVRDLTRSHHCSSALLRRGLRKTDFPAGIEIVVTGFLAKNGSPTANGRTVTLPDGRDFFAGSSGTGALNDGAER